MYEVQLYTFNQITAKQMMVMNFAMTYEQYIGCMNVRLPCT